MSDSRNPFSESATTAAPPNFSKLGWVAAVIATIAALTFLVGWYNALERQHELESLQSKFTHANDALSSALADNAKFKEQLDSLQKQVADLEQENPECARVMALMGAELLLYPTAIGSEPYDTDLDTSRMWRRAMQGHAVSNCLPVIAANRIGVENGQSFYGHSFISDEWGDLVAEYGGAETGVLVAQLDLARAARHRAGMGFFRDRRPQLYGRIAQDI